MLKKAQKIYYGGDYNPDQWEDEIIDQDMKLFKEAGVNLLTLPVFSWAKLEPKEGVYNFKWLDDIIDKIWSNGISICLATPTSAQPSWLSTQYPEVLPVDIAGRKRTHGMRVFFCVNSEKYRQRAAAMAQQMAMRYGKHPALAVWHVANEYGTYCYCPTCQQKFRQWLLRRYGSIENLNEKWTTAFWGRTFYSFEEILLPTQLNDDYRFNPVIELDYRRFVTDSTVECFLNEYDVIKKYTPDIPISTNISGFIKKIDQFEMLKHMDVAGWDNYPNPKDDKSLIALKHDIMRGLKSGQSYMLTEQSPNQQNWQPYNKLKRPGEVRILSYQALAHGADTCLYFQMRQSIAGQEKFHGAVISHGGSSDTRVFKECAKLGRELKILGDSFIGGRIKAEIGLLFDWNNWWALELSSGPSKDINYLNAVAKYYKAFYEKNIPVDILSVEADLKPYKIIIAPMLYMIKEGVSEKIEAFVKEGGTFIATTMTGLVDSNDRCVFGQYPGKLRKVLGIWVEETDALFPEEINGMVMEPSEGWAKSQYSCSLLCDLIHTITARVLAVYSKDFYKDVPCFTMNTYGNGEAYYIGTEPDEEFLKDFVSELCTLLEIKPMFQASAGVEITQRITEKTSVVFVINHNASDSEVDFGKNQFVNILTMEVVTGVTKLPAREVMVLKNY